MDRETRERVVKDRHVKGSFVKCYERKKCVFECKGGFKE